MRRVILLSVGALLLSGKLSSQDQYFVNSTQSLISLNPSFAGTNGYIRNQFNFSQQWVSYAGAPQTIANSADVFISPLQAGIAVSGLQNRIGSFSHSEISMAYAQHLFFFKDQLKVIPSIQIGYGVNDYNSDWIIMSSQRPSTNPPRKKEYLDIGSGLLVNFKNLYLGASAFHFDWRDIWGGEPKPAPILNYHISYNIHSGESTLLNFSARVISTRRYYQRNTYIFGANAVFMKHIITGVSYELDESVYVNAGYRGRAFSVQAGYTFVNKGSYSSAFHLMATLNLRTKEKRDVLVNFEEW